MAEKAIARILFIFLVIAAAASIALSTKRGEPLGEPPANPLPVPDLRNGARVYHPYLRTSR
jgi:hypothetical protein